MYIYCKYVLFFTVFIVFLYNTANCKKNFSDVPCGHLKRAGRIVGGSDASRGEFPFIVSITRRGGHFCGGAVLNNKYILTAGHCMCSGLNKILKPSQIKITISQHDLTEGDNPYKTEMDIEEIITHGNYKCTKVNDDIALLKVVGEIKWSDFVSPICMPDFEKKDLVGLDATVAGWGWLNEDSDKGGRANKLQKANVVVLENSVCKDWFNSQNKKNQIENTQMCAGFEQGGVDSCWADSGGPLFANMDGSLTLVGVVSTGVGCARPRLPGIYTRITSYMDWIEENIV